MDPVIQRNLIEIGKVVTDRRIAELIRENIRTIVAIGGLDSSWSDGLDLRPDKDLEGLRDQVFGAAVAKKTLEAKSLSTATTNS
jgi:hypothetical protein